MTGRIMEIGLDKIHPNRRDVIEMQAIEALCESIRSKGLEEPIKLWFDGQRLRILDGEKRWRVYKRLGISRIKAHIDEVPPVVKPVADY
jgi:ParB-like chromosome segregation protein Spo0J